MSYFFCYDRSAGDFIGWYRDDVHADIPQPAIEVSDAEYNECRAKLNEGKIARAVNGAIVFSEVVPDIQSVKQTRITTLRFRYNEAQQPRVSFTNAARFTATYGATDTDKANLKAVIDAGATAWTLELWLDVDGAPVAPMTFKDLQNLKKMMDLFKAPTYDLLLSKINEVLNATSVAAVNAVTM